MVLREIKPCLGFLGKRNYLSPLNFLLFVLNKLIVWENGGKKKGGKKC